MTLLSTRKREIEALEGFAIDIQLSSTGLAADLKTQGLPSYDYARKAAGTMTVLAWKTQRFSASYPGYSCDVLHKDGTVAHGNTLLQTVRA